MAPPGPEFVREQSDRLESAHEVVWSQLQSASQKRNYDVHYRGRHSEFGKLFWVHKPHMEIGRCPKLNSNWTRLCRVQESFGKKFSVSPAVSERKGNLSCLLLLTVKMSNNLALKFTESK